MKITQANTPTVWMDCHPIHTNWCPHLCHPTIFMPDALPDTTLPIYPGLGQAPNMLACIPSGSRTKKQLAEVYLENGPKTMAVPGVCVCVCAGVPVSTKECIITDFATLGIWSKQVDNLQSRLQDLLFNTHLNKRRSIGMDLCHTVTEQTYRYISGLVTNVLIFSKVQQANNPNVPYSAYNAALLLIYSHNG